MYYLKKVMAVYAGEEQKKSFSLLQERLEREGIALRLSEREALSVRSFAEANGGEGVLWMTDSPLCAGQLAAWGEAVIIFLHEGNQGEDFSGLRYALEKPEETEAEYLEQVYRRFYGIPWDILETERCVVRETIPEDVEAFYEIYSDSRMTRYMEDLYPDIEEEKQYVRDYIEKQYGFYGFGVWTILKKDTGEVIGRAGLFPREGFEELELGFLIGVPWQGQGLATEVCRAVLEYGRDFLGVERIQALVMPENKASAAVCGKLGFYKAENIILNCIEYVRFLCDL